MYNYKNAMLSDILDAVAERYTVPEILEELENAERWKDHTYDELWADDAVTGNASGSYTCNRLKAREYVLDNMDILRKAFSEFGSDDATAGEHFLNEDWEWFDVTIRCYLLYRCVDIFVDVLAENVNILAGENIDKSKITELLEEAA